MRARASSFPLSKALNLVYRRWSSRKFYFQDLDIIRVQQVISTLGKSVRNSEQPDENPQEPAWVSPYVTIMVLMIATFIT